MAGSKQILRTDFTRVWIAEGGAGPGRPYEYQDTMKAGALRWPAGEPTDVEIPDGDNYGRMLKVDQIPAEDQKPTLPVVNRFPRNRASVLARIRRQGCLNDIQVHIGTCEDPRDFDNGWGTGKVLVLQQATLTDYSTDELGALASAERNPVNETGTFTGLDYYEIFNLTWGESAAADVEGEVIAVAICDRQTCSGLCGTGSDGCQVVFAVTLDVGSVGAGVGVAVSSNGGSTWRQSDLDAASGGDPTAVACVGPYLVITTNAGESHAVALVTDLKTGDESWAEVTTGYESGKGPNALSSVGSTRTWIVGDTGSIYFSEDITSSVTLQHDGDLTTEDLLAVHALDSDNVLVGGGSNVILRSVDGGESWSLITGPAVGVAINTVWMITETEWIVGTAGGRVFYTEDEGETWEESGFSGQGTGVVEDIKFATPIVAYMSHTLAGAGRVFRSINAGRTWVRQTDVPTNDRINSLAVCNNANRVFAGGLAANGTDGFVAKGTSA